MKACIKLIVLISFLQYHLCKIPSSAESVKDVVAIEIVMFKSLAKYIEEEKQKIQVMERYLETQQRQYQTAKKDIEFYLGSPINMFTLIKRMVVEWEKIEDSASSKSGDGLIKIVKIHQECYKYPRTTTLLKSALAITNLQDIYDMNASSVADGVLNGQKYNVTLSGSDCYALGKQAYEKRKYSHALEWFQEANVRLNIVPDYFINKEDILDHLALAAFRSGNPMLALEYTKEVLKVSPSHERALHNLPLFTAKAETKPNTESLFTHIESKILMRTKQLCRNEHRRSESLAAVIKCRYVSYDNPFLFIAPFKMEEVHLEPELLIFHDVISDKDMEMIKRLWIEFLAKEEISKSAENEANQIVLIKNVIPIETDQNLRMTTISKRIEDMTDLTMEMREPFFVTNYGIDGFYYYSHDDAIPAKYVKRSKNLTRLATMIIHINHIEQGGALVFPLLNVAIQPEKGAAIMWSNVNVEGNDIKENLYAICPVLIGSKWAVHKWIFQAKQKRVTCSVEDFMYTKEAGITTVNLK